MLELFNKLLKKENVKDFTTIHPRHMEDHLRSLAKKNHLASKELTIIYLEQIYSKYLAEDKIDGTPFDNAVLDALEKLKKE